MDETDAAAAEAQSGENESNPDLDLYPPASPVGNTFWCQCGECFARDRRQDCVCCFDLCRARGESSLSVERLHVDLQLSRSTCHCLHAFSLSYLFWIGVERLFEHDQAPSKCLPQQQVSGNLLFFATCASLPRRWIVHSPLFVYFLQIFAVSGSDWSRRAATQQTSWKFLVPRKSMKAHATLSMLVGLLQSKAQQKTVFSVAVQLGDDCVTDAIRSIVAPFKAMELSTRGKADTESGRVLPKSPARKKFRESLHLHMSSSVEIFVRPATDQCKSKVGNLCYASYKQSIHRWTASRGVKKAKFNLFLGQLPRQISSSNLYQTRVIR